MRVLPRIFSLPRLPFKRLLLSFPPWLAMIMNHPYYDILNDIPGYKYTNEYRRINHRCLSNFNNIIYLNRDNTALTWRYVYTPERNWMEASLMRHGLTNPDQVCLFYHLVGLNNTHSPFSREFRLYTDSVKDAVIHNMTSIPLHRMINHLIKFFFW